MQPQEMIDGIDKSLADLAQKLAAVEQEKLALTSALDGLKEARARLVALQAGATPAPEKTLPPVGNAVGTPEPPSPRAEGVRGPHVLAVLSILTEAKRPLAAAEVARALGQRGTKGTGSVLRDIVHSVLRRRRDLFRKVKQDGRVVWELEANPNGRIPQGRAGKQAPGEKGDRSAASHHGNGTARSQGPTLFHDLAGKTIEEAARIILAEHDNESMHYSAIAEEAERRGYSSGRSVVVAPSSFAVMLDRKKEVFEKLGGGMYKLRIAEEASKG